MLSDRADAGRPWAFLVSLTGCAADIRRHMGKANYSYTFFYEALRPVLERFGECRVVEAPESRLDAAAAEARRRGRRPLHLVMLPPQSAYYSPSVPTVLLPAWEFPEVPLRDLGRDPRQNWARACRPAAAIWAGSGYSADAIRAAGLGPVEVVSAPLPASAFDAPPWDPSHAWTYRGRHLVLQGGGTRAAPAGPPPGSIAHRAYARCVQPVLSPLAVERIRQARGLLARRPRPDRPLLPEGEVTLSGLVFTSLFNLSDRRKNARDLISAALSALGDRPDATLAIKLATSPAREHDEVRELLGLYHDLGMDHACRVVVITGYLGDEEMAGLFRASTYYLNASHAEGACLPIQQAMAAGRPAVAPTHTAMGDYMDDSVGFAVESHPEPTFWPHDPDQRHETTWQRLVWSSLRDQIRAAADLATRDRPAYDALASRARERVLSYAGIEAVAGALGRALGRLESGRVDAA